MGDDGDEQARIESRLHQRIETMLREALGSAAPYSVSVDVQLNYDRVKQVRDNLVPQGKDGNGLLTRQKTANSHPGTPTEADATHVQGASGESELEYAHSREQEEIEVAPGKVARISVGILVPQSVNPQTIAKLDTVIADAVGLDPQRGDHLDIAAVAGLTAIAPPAGIESVPAVSARPAAAVQGWSAFGFSWQMLISIAALACVCLSIGWVLARSRQPRRLTMLERERLLRDVQQWIEAPEQT
jgi:flagellar M-ring protein FliF